MCLPLIWCHTPMRARLNIARTLSADSHAILRSNCRFCNGRCHVKDVRSHRIATLFGEVRVRLPRFLCDGCDRTDTGVSWPSNCSSTLELDQLQARLSALMPYRVAADMLAHMLPIDIRKSPETLRSHTVQIGEQFGDAAVDQRTAATAVITVSLCSTFIGGREDGKRHLEFRVGNVEATAGERQVFAAVTKADTDFVALIRRNLETAGQTDAAEMTAFTDGCPGRARYWPMPGSRSHQFSIGSTLPCGCSTQRRPPVDYRPPTPVG
jgi:hypothetical protein